MIISDSSLDIGDSCHLGINDLDYLTKKYNKKVLSTHLRDETRNIITKGNFENIIVKEDFYEIEI